MDAVNSGGGPRGPGGKLPGDTRTRILAAALEMFAERGVASATTAQIARHAGVAEKTLFAHFKTKEALFEQVLTPSVLSCLIPETADLETVFHAHWDRLDEFLAAMMKNRMRFYRQHPHEFKFVLQEVLLRPELGREFIATIARQVALPIEKVLLRLRSKGELGAIPLERVHRTGISVLLGLVTSRLLLWPVDAAGDDAEIDAAVAILVRGLQASPATTARAASEASAPSAPPRGTPRASAKTARTATSRGSAQPSASPKRRPSAASKPPTRSRSRT